MKLAYFMEKQGKFPREEVENMEKIIEKHKNNKEYAEKQFALDMIEIFGRGIRGLKEDCVRKAGEEYIASHSEDRFPFTEELLAMMKNDGYELVVVSGSPVEIIFPFSKRLGVDKVFATEYEVENGTYTGKIFVSFSVFETKREIIRRYLEKGDFDLSASVGFGNSRHDLAFLELVGSPVAVKPDEELERIARERGWLICHGDDKALDLIKLYLGRKK